MAYGFCEDVIENKRERTPSAPPPYPNRRISGLDWLLNEDLFEEAGRALAMKETRILHRFGGQAWRPTGDSRHPPGDPDMGVRVSVTATGSKAMLGWPTCPAMCAPPSASGRARVNRTARANHGPAPVNLLTILLTHSLTWKRPECYYPRRRGCPMGRYRYLLGSAAHLFLDGEDEHGNRAVQFQQAL